MNQRFHSLISFIHLPNRVAKNERYPLAEMECAAAKGA